MSSFFYYLKKNVFKNKLEVISHEVWLVRRCHKQGRENNRLWNGTLINLEYACKTSHTQPVVGWIGPHEIQIGRVWWWFVVGIVWLIGFAWLWMQNGACLMNYLNGDCHVIVVEKTCWMFYFDSARCFFSAIWF